MKLTKSQQAVFWRSLDAACRHQGLTSGADRDRYRRRVIAKETAKSSLKDINRTSDFDAVLMRLHADAGDYEAALRCDSGTERRWAYLVEVCALQLTQLMDDQPDPLAYVIGILNQAGYKGHYTGQVWWLDLTADRLQALFQMLDTHRRRILKRTGSCPLKFDPGVAYGRDHAGPFRASATSYPDTQRLIRIA